MFDIQPTEEVKAMKDLTVMNNHSDFALSQFIEYTTHAYHAFWNGEASPATKLAMLGTQALAAFTLHQATQEFILTVKPDHVVLGIPEGFAIEWNQDGTGTITIVE